MIWATIIAKALALANTLAAYFKTKQDQDAGVAIQRSADLTANAKASTDATVIHEHNAALSRDQLVERLRDQTGVDP